MTDIANCGYDQLLVGQTVASPLWAGPFEGIPMQLDLADVDLRPPTPPAPEGTWFGLGDAIRSGDALVYQVVPATAFGFEKGQQFSQTRWRF